MPIFDSLGNRQPQFNNPANFSDISFKKENRHGKHKNLNYYQEYYQKHRKKILAYSRDYYKNQQLLENYLKRKDKITNSAEKFTKILKENGVKKNSFSHEQACIYSNSLSIKRNRCFLCSWIKACDRQNIRLATREKKPQYRVGSNWPYIKEKRRVWELLNQYGEWGSRTGKRIGKKWYVRIDLDLLLLPKPIKATIEKGVELLRSQYRVLFIKTKKGYHVILLLDKVPANGAIYHVDKFGVKRKIGDILSTGRQAQDVGSPNKEQPTEKGKWFWQATDIQEVSKVWEKYFLLIECREKKSIATRDILSVKENLNKSVGVNLTKQITSEKKANQLIIRLAQILKKELFKPWIKRTKPIYKVWYRQNNQSQRYFLLDTYQNHRDLALNQLSIGIQTNFVLNQGNPYQFFSGFV